MVNQFNPEEINLTVGLGNPADKYRGTYHNVGRTCIEFLKKEFPKLENQMHLVKSDAFMNNSGKFVNRVLQEKSSSPAELLIIHDDSDITLGDYKLSFGRGSAGHKGIESIQDHLRTKDFWRARIGIRTEENEEEAGDFVLQHIKEGERDLLQEVFREIGEMLIL